MRYRFLKGSCLQFPDPRVKFAVAVHVIGRSFEYDYPTAPPFTARCLHPPGTATVWEIRHYSIEITMSKRKEKCSVVGCKDQHKTLHRLQAAEDKRAAWIEFIFEGIVPAEVNKKLLVCANHFDADCFTNLGQYKTGVVSRLLLKGILVDQGHVSIQIICCVFL